MSSTHFRPVFAASRTLTTASLILALTSVSHAGLNAMTYKGCFSSSAPLVDQGSYEYQTSGYCQPLCVDQNDSVLGLSGGSDCWCGDELPAADSLVDDSYCNTACNGYGSEDCGGTNYWSVYLSGTEDDVSNYSGSSSSTTTATTAAATTSSAESSAATTAKTTTAPSVVTSVAPGTTIVVTESASAETQSSSATASAKSSGGSTNVTGVAVGAVVGVLAVLALAGGAFYFWRRKRQQAAEKQYQRSNQVSDFMRGASERKPPTTAYSNMSDNRLDPEAGRRNSAGSIADDQDYSRRILRVANPDA